jgi:PTS system nitrogen regulatory IIA component
MMEIEELIEPERVIAGLSVADKAELLSDLAELSSRYTGVAPDWILKALTKRESFGSTGIGRGVAIPHTSVKGLKRPVGFLVRLERPIDFESVDGEPVDLVFLLLTPPTPASENVAVLAAVSRRLRDAPVLRGLRTGKSFQEIYYRLVGHS